MLTSLSELWRARRGRRAAVAAIAPLVQGTRSRLREIPDPTWDEPYMVGFLVMLITLVARRSVKRLDTQSLALVQCEAWAEITGVTWELIGEEVLHLSAIADKEFMQGCRDAVEFSGALERRAPAAAGDRSPDMWNPAAGHVTDAQSEPYVSDADVEGAAVSDLWATFFEARVIAWRADAMALFDRERPIG